jgi:hypothetical protein
MGSPFPGVDPFLEGQGVWQDFHHGFIFCWREMLMRKLPSNYIARLDEHVYLDRGADEEVSVQRIPDVLVEQRSRTGTEREAAGVVTIKPTILRHIIGDPIREGYIEVVRRSDNKLVAVLELLSPTNKRGAGRGEYLLKRDQILHSPAHLVEVDMLLRGPRMPFYERLPDGHFFAMVSRGDRRPDCEVFPWTVEDRLPSIPIPLEAPDPDVVMDLHQVYETTFARGPYDELVEYNQPIGFPMDEAMQKWVDERLSGRKKLNA